MELNTTLVLLLFACLSVAVAIDLFVQRIPNWLVATLLLVGGAGHFWSSQWLGLGWSVSGIVIGLLCFTPFYVFGQMGAGDVKFLAAIGAVIGPKLIVISAILAVVLGGAIAVVYITIRGGLPAMVRRYSSMMVLLVAKQPAYIPPAPGEAAGLRFPYALAIACGTAIALFGF